MHLIDDLLTQLIRYWSLQIDPNPTPPLFFHNLSAYFLLQLFVNFSIKSLEKLAGDDLVQHFV